MARRVGANGEADGDSIGDDKPTKAEGGEVSWCKMDDQALDHND